MDELVRKCVDMDEWKHSWHNQFKTLQDYKKAAININDKIKKREEELIILKSGLERVKEIISAEEAYLNEIDNNQCET